MRRNITRTASRFRHYIFAKIWYDRQQAVYIKTNYWVFFKLWVLAQDRTLSCFLEVAFIDKTHLHPSALLCLRTNLSLNADVSENTLPFVGQFTNNFSDYYWEYPSLSPHVLLMRKMQHMGKAIFYYSNWNLIVCGRLVGGHSHNDWFNIFTWHWFKMALIVIVRQYVLQCTVSADLTCDWMA